MKSAVYARKSNDDSDKNTDNKSVTRQVERARAYAAAKGWETDDDLIFVDDGISGAEYQNRPGFNRLLTQLKEFDALIMSESSRLGRDMLRNAYYIGEIIEAGVKIFYYLTDEEERADTPEQKIMVTLKSYASETERQKASQRSRDALSRKAAKGYCTGGGGVYGYKLVRVEVENGDGEMVRSHTDYEVEETESGHVVTFYNMRKDGLGLQTIAKTLNGDPRYKQHAARYFKGELPTPPRTGTGSWSPSSLRAILHNRRYLGLVPFGKTRGVYKGGTKRREYVGEPTWAERPDLRIVSDELWDAVQKQNAAAAKDYIRNTNGTLWGRPGMGAESKYLLTGLGRCAICGANITVLGGRTGGPGNRRPRYYYGCAHRQNRGTTVCTNDHRIHMDALDDAVLVAIEEQILTPAIVTAAVEHAVEIIVDRRKQDTKRPKELERETRQIKRELDNLINLAASGKGKAPARILAEIAAREAKIKALENEAAELTLTAPTEVDLRRLKKGLEQQAAQWRALVRDDVPRARQALRKLLTAPLTFTPDHDEEGRKGYTFEGHTHLGVLLPPGYIGVALPRERHLNQ